jgi:phosphohistidine swiveling domain-containing protein
VNASTTAPFVLPFEDIGDDDLGRVGGKGQNLGLMTRAGLPVPAGFCVTTAAFERFIEGVDGFHELLATVDALDPEDVEGVREHALRLRERCEAAPLPDGVVAACLEAWRALGEGRAYAVRSSATLEDLPDASFAGQQDTYLNVCGEDALLDAVRRCWASLFTDRAVLYRRQQGFISEGARLSVVVQQMAAPVVSGILFTADPLTGHRGICSIDASWGLGEALVSGLVNADLYKVEKATGKVASARVAHKALGIFALEGGGTEQRDLDDAQADARVLSDEDCGRLAELARQVEGHYQKPQDIEWCLEEDGALKLVQTRPITSLYPAPDTTDDSFRIFGSFGHVQVMTEPIRPFGYSVMQVVLPLGKDRSEDKSDLCWNIGHRLYIDLTVALHRFPFSFVLPRLMAGVDAGMRPIVEALMKRPAFKRRRPPGRIRHGRVFRHFLRPVLGGAFKNLLRRDVENAADEFNGTMVRVVGEWRERVAAAGSLRERVRLLPKVLGGVFDALLPVFPPMVLPGVISWALLNKLMGTRVAKEQIEQLTRGLEGNLTTQMDLELGDLADLFRTQPELRALVMEGEPKTVMASIAARDDAADIAQAWTRFLEHYGHRAPSEIDASRTRWREDPSSLVISLRGMLASDEIGGHRAHERRMQEGAREAAEAIVDAARQGLFGGLRARVATKLIANIRAFMALREHGKYYAMQLIEIAHLTAKEVGATLAANGQLRDEKDVFLFTIDELLPLLDGEIDGVQDRIDATHASLARAAKLSPPRILTSDGEAPVPPPPENLPEGALGGLGASSGVIEGVARVVLDPTREVLQHGEILIAPFTDPGWTPLFVHAAGLVMEVGGLVTHGSVVAREYGIPAVVGVDHATTRIKTGDRIRVDGSQGFVIPLPPLLDDQVADDPGAVPLLEGDPAQQVQP